MQECSMLRDIIWKRLETRTYKDERGNKSLENLWAIWDGNLHVVGTTFLRIDYNATGVVSGSKL